MKFAEFVLTGVIALLFSGCKDKSVPEPSKPGARPGTEAVPDPSPSAGAFAVPDSFKAAMGKVYQGYSEMQEALARDDLAKAKAGFESMHTVLHMMPKDGLDPSAAAYWDSTDARIMEALHPLATAVDIATVRAHFLDFSSILIDAIGKFGIGGADPVYQFHCPMADGNRGADWLQKDKALRNPYFGKSMPTCGKLVRTIKG